MPTKQPKNTPLLSEPQIFNGSRGWKYTQILSNWGTILYVDPVTGQLRHGPIEAVPGNLFFVTGAEASSPRQRGLLVSLDGNSDKLIKCNQDGSLSVSDDEWRPEKPLTMSLIHLERGIVAIEANKNFISCIPNGLVMLGNDRCSWWEFLHLSEDWRPDYWPSEASEAAEDFVLGFPNIDSAAVKSFIVGPRVRPKIKNSPARKKILIYGYPQWSHGRVYYDLSKLLYERGYIVDILNWQENHAAYFNEFARFYDLFITACDGVQTLVDAYNVPYEQIITISHHENDARMLIEQKGIEVFDRFRNYGVVSEFLYCASLMKGVTRVPIVASPGVNFKEFHSDIPTRLETVGYASSMSVKTYEVEWKRGELAEAAARNAGLAFKVAGSTGNQTSFHDMPEFYRSVDAILTSSISEAAQLPVMEAAAAGRLVIGTPVGHFPRRAYQGGGILAPIEAEKFKTFVAATLRYYKENPIAYVEKCHSIQEAARSFDWRYSIGEWIDLIEAGG
jgi:glycosyltransferase involved in cell wall biosynthesis